MKPQFTWQSMKERALNVAKDYYTTQGEGWDFYCPQKMEEHLLLMFALERLCKRMNIDVSEWLSESAELLVCPKCAKFYNGFCIGHKQEPYWQRKVIEDCKDD